MESSFSRISAARLPLFVFRGKLFLYWMSHVMQIKCTSLPTAILITCERKRNGWKRTAQERRKNCKTTWARMVIYYEEHRVILLNSRQMLAGGVISSFTLIACPWMLFQIIVYMLNNDISYTRTIFWKLSASSVWMTFKKHNKFGKQCSFC